MAYRISGDKKFLNAADACAGYILGANLTGYCFITGLGSNYPMHVHERRSSADGVKEPVPGMVIGGPSLQATNDCGKSSYPSSYPALSYIDDECSYSTNETAINWNAAGTFLFLGLSSEYATFKTMNDE